ncbi:MAG: hypothetical protein K6G80_07210 [Treponema sp.]|nr:hypothetical protein [Treponema sp.]
MDTILLLIDPQNDFCASNGALYVPGAEKDAVRLAQFIQNNQAHIENIHVTMDCHPYYHVAHPCFWKDKDGNHPSPFTIITRESFKNHEYTPVDPALYNRMEEYIITLESRARFMLTIWPPHCLLGTEGFSVYQPISDALCSWEQAKTGRIIDFVKKARNPFTEHYSAIGAEVPDPADPDTRTNFTLIDKLRNKRIYVAGEALSHCVANTLRDLFMYIDPGEVTLLRDCTSIIPGYEKFAASFITEYTAKGMKVSDSTELL